MSIRNIIVGILFLLVQSTLQAADPLVNAKWLAANLEQQNLVILDLQPKAAYAQFHVPGAINSNYADWRKPDAKGIPKMLPAVADLEALIGSLGIDNETQVVLVVTGRSASEMASATRVYWTLKAVGHDQVSILNGGLIAYASSRKNRLERDANTPSRRVFKANLRTDYLVTGADIKASLGAGFTVVDNRSVAEHMGLLGGGGKERAGTIPGAKNIPFAWLMLNSGAVFHTADNIKQIFQVSGVSNKGPQVSFCHTGHRASLGWFVAHELLENSAAKMYDGSTADWAVDRSLPIEVKINLMRPIQGAISQN